MTIAIVTILVLVCVAVLVYPFLTQSSTRSGPQPGEEMAAQIRRARDRVYEEIRALQQEYFLDNLTEAEYQAQLQAARRRAAALVREQQQVQTTVADVEAAVEEELRLAAEPYSHAATVERS
ncbi:MAG: hypothetical protein WD645_06490 [Dehalococcoidia bacterium]